ncbi:MAG: c-type cytochrome domain-containing protein [Desulfobacterales bacterium]|nr:c-type cytochrome domain-containing protein [Desulfobacterales bacterium]
MNFDFIYHFLADLGYTHPLHPTLTHLTIGLVIAAVIFRAIALLPAYGKYGQTARHCSTLAFLAIFPTVVLGLMDWAYYYGANWMFPIKMKMILAGALMVLLLLAIILNLKLSKGSGALLVIYLLAFLTVIGLGYFGGEIVYGKRSAPGGNGEPAAEKSAAIGTPSDAAAFAEVQTIFRNNCTNCHAGANPPSSLDLTSYENVMNGGQNGPVVVSGKPGKSELIRRARGISTPQMPLAGPALAESAIRTLEKWIAAGAPAPNR